jgi:hypothetical protein
VIAFAEVAAGQTPPKSSVRPPEATTCHSDSECVVSGVVDEWRDGTCCPRCNQYEALNRTWVARHPPCDAHQRGSCAISCIGSARPVPVPVCASQHCFLSYPPMKSTCNTDYDCVALPALSTTVASNGCRISCGQYTLASRSEAAPVRELYRDVHASGTCLASCVDPIPDTECRLHQCAPVDAMSFRIRGATATAPTITGPVTTVDVQSVVYRRLGQFASCSEQARSIRPRSSFTFELGFYIEGDGRVTTVDTRQISSKFPDIASCIESLTRKWQFARPLGGQRAEVRYPVQLAFEDP